MTNPVIDGIPDRGEPSTGAPRGRVLFVSTVSYLGGAERSLLELAHALPRLGWQPSLAAWHPGPLPEAFERYGFPVHVYQEKGRQPGSPLGGFATRSQLLESMAKRAIRVAIMLRPISQESAWLQSVIRGGAYSVVHSNCDLSIPSAFDAARRAGVPYIAHVRDQVRHWFHPRIRDCLRRADAVVATSEYLAGCFREAGVEAHVVYNPIDSTVYRQAVDRDDRDRWRGEFGIQDAFAVAVVGRIVPQKRVDVAIRATALLARGGARAVLVVAGQGPSPVERELRGLASGLGVHERVRWLGLRTDIPQWLPAMDALVMPSSGEPFGRVIVEGMLAGLPVIASADGAAPELIRHGVTGMLVSADGDVSSGFAVAIRKLIEDPDLRFRIGDAARREALARFDPMTSASRIVQLYQAVVSTGGAEV